MRVFQLKKNLNVKKNLTEYIVVRENFDPFTIIYSNLGCSMGHDCFIICEFTVGMYRVLRKLKSTLSCKRYLHYLA